MRFLSFLILLSLCACSSKDKEPKSIYGVFDAGFKDIAAGNYDDAAKEFRKIYTYFPYSSLASKAQLLSAYSKYKIGGNDDIQKCIRDLDVFIMFKGNNEYTPYAKFLRAVCLLKQVSPVGRSQEKTLKAKAAFVDIINTFSQSVYAKNAEEVILQLDNSLAAHEMNVAKFYQKNKNPVAASGRYMYVVQNYIYTNQAPEALFRLIECYLEIGIHTIANSVHSEISRLFPNNEWKLKSDKLMLNNNALNKESTNIRVEQL